MASADVMLHFKNKGRFPESMQIQVRPDGSPPDAVRFANKIFVWEVYKDQQEHYREVSVWDIKAGD